MISPRYGIALASVLLLAVGPARLGAQTDTTARPRVLVIATGGTIAGVQDSAGTLGRYRAGTLSAEAIIASVPELARFAEVEAEQFSNVASPLITPDQWVALSRRVNAVLRERPELTGVVVTHGTDRLEETAFFLYLTVRSPKPVVVVGSQRPATGISPDGPINLLAAVRTVAAPSAYGKGVMVVMDDRILSAREVRKQYQRVGGFTVGEMGMLGVVAADGPTFFFAPVRRHGTTSEFDVGAIDALPRVELTFSYPGGTGPRFAADSLAADSLPAGVVVTTTGFTRAESVAYRALRRAGVALVTVFPSGDNVNGASRGPSTPVDTTTPPVTAADSVRRLEASTPRAISAQHLTPQKARILLMLALTRTREPAEIQRIFIDY
jgi:L-asparaginase